MRGYQFGQATLCTKGTQGYSISVSMLRALWLSDSLLSSAPTFLLNLECGRVTIYIRTSSNLLYPLRCLSLILLQLDVSFQDSPRISTRLTWNSVIIWTSSSSVGKSLSSNHFLKRFVYYKSYPHRVLLCW